MVASTQDTTIDDRATRVLLVDDSLAVLIQLRNIVATLPGCEVVGTARDGAAGVQQYAVLQPDVVVMDVIMPVLGGIEAARAIVATDPSARIVMLTSVADSADNVYEALKTGAATVLRKPPSVDELARALRGEPAESQSG